MAGTPRCGILAAMQTRMVTITLEVQVAGEAVSGRATDGAHQPREFSGRLGLLGAIDALLASQGNVTTPSRKGITDEDPDHDHDDRRRAGL
jgi:hypothetical protein